MYNLYEIHLKKIHGCFLSGRYMFLAENSIVEDPSASANSAIWCKFDDSSRATNLPQHLTDREALPRELPCGPPASHAIGIFLSSWSFSLAPLQKPTQSCQRLCQNRDRSLKEHPLFSLKSMSHQPSCYLSTVNSTALMVNFTSRKRLHFVKRKFWTLTSLIFKWLAFTNLHHPNLFHSSGLCFSKQNQVVSL